jgi:hypothetical protein
MAKKEKTRYSRLPAGRGRPDRDADGVPDIDESGGPLR